MTAIDEVARAAESGAAGSGRAFAGRPGTSRRGVGIAGILVGAILGWSYGGTLARLVGRWYAEPDYVYGFLVIPFAGLLLWLRREKIRGWDGRGSWWGLGLLLVTGVMRCLSAYLSDPVLEPLSLVPCLAGVALVFGGTKTLRWAWPSIVFLAFMIPLPSFTASMLSSFLQRVVTVSSTFVLQASGIAAVADGNVIVLPDGELGVIDACSGLRSVMLFLTVAVGAAMLLEGLADRLIIVVSAAPVTIAANVVRVALTGILYETTSREWAEAVFHDLAGLFMLPLAVGMLWVEIRLLRRVLVRRVPSRPVLFGRSARREILAESPPVAAGSPTSPPGP